MTSLKFLAIRTTSRCCTRYYCVQLKQKKGLNKMFAWQVHSYNEELQLTKARFPIITQPNEILIKVEAASVNPIDTYMKGRNNFTNCCHYIMICLS